MVSRILAALRAAFTPAQASSDAPRCGCGSFDPDALQRVDRIPHTVLPDGPARDTLISLALGGHDVDAYIPAASQEWVIWCRPAHPSLDGRYSIERWRREYASEYARIVSDAWKEDC